MPPADGWHIIVTLFDVATNVAGGRVVDHEPRIDCALGPRTACIRCVKDTGLRNLPLQGFVANEIWLEIVALANDLLAWTQHLAWTGSAARAWEPNRLRLRLLTLAGRINRTGRRTLLRLPRSWPWARLILTGHQRLAAYGP